MARSSSSRNRRVIFTNANRRLPVSPTRSRVTSTYLTQIEDRRLWHPEGIYAPAKSFNQSRHRLVAQPIARVFTGSGYKLTRPSTIAFAAPKKVLICVRRGIRKQVLHALNKTGKVGQNRPRRSYYSSISC